MFASAVVGVNPFAGFNVLCGPSYGHTVLEHFFAFCDVVQGIFVTELYVVTQHDVHGYVVKGRIDLLALLEIDEGRGHVVLYVE